ncbi:MAG: carboxypeptidase-like regulatory domain-containing protein, partial [Bacteroidota bacterium]
MHKISLVLLFIFLNLHNLFSQSASISGKILDQKSGLPLAYASISLYTSIDSSLSTQMLSDRLGKFSFKTLAKGSYFLRYSFFGYESHKSPGYRIKAGEKLELGEIALRPSQLLLKEIEISGRREGSYIRTDRKVYTTLDFGYIRGGNGLMALQILPSVSINSLGDISA